MIQIERLDLLQMPEITTHLTVIDSTIWFYRTYGDYLIPYDRSDLSFFEQYGSGFFIHGRKVRSNVQEGWRVSILETGIFWCLIIIDLHTKRRKYIGEIVDMIVDDMKKIYPYHTTAVSSRRCMEDCLQRPIVSVKHHYAAIKIQTWWRAQKFNPHNHIGRKFIISHFSI